MAAFYCSKLNGRKICWPVRIIRTGDYVYVEGLAGRFKGRQFSVGWSEISSYIPHGYNLAPGAKAFLPKVGDEFRKAKLIGNRIVAARNTQITPKQTQRFLLEIERLGESLYPRTSNDIAWEYYKKDREKALVSIDRGHFQYALDSLLEMAHLILGAAVREAK